MNKTLRALARSLLVSTCLFTVSASLHAAQFYATVAGAGSKNGSSWAHAFDQAGIQGAVNGLAAGDTLNIGSGTYNNLQINIASGGTSSSAIKTIRGIDTGSGLPILAGSASGNASYDNQATTSNAFTFTGSTSSVIRWVTIEDFVVSNHGAAVLFKSPDSRSSSSSVLPRFPDRECFTDIVIANVDGTKVFLGVMIVQAKRVLVMDCDFVQFGFRAFNLWSYSSDITFDACTADGLGTQTVTSWVMNAFPNGFYTTDCSSSGEINHITYVDCVAKNILTNTGNTSSSTYWNGDGFSSEEFSYNFTYIRCKAINCEDGGFDDKASNVVFEGCVAIGNKRGFRYHAGPPNLTPMATYNDCLAAYSSKRGGSSSEDGFWIANDQGASTSTVVTLNNCTAHNNKGAGVKTENNAAITVNVNDSILSYDGSVSGAVLVNAASVTTVNIASSTAQYPNSGTNPNYVAASAGWIGSPANAFDSQTYGAAKGYHSTNVDNDTQAPTVPTAVAASSITTSSFTLSWTASTDDVGVTGYEVFRDGTSIATPSGTSVSVTGLSASTTYAMRVRARDAAGNWSAQSTAINVTTATGSGSGTTLRIEAGSTSSYTDSNSAVWSPDTGYTGGGIVDRGSIAIANTIDDKIYQTERWGISSYALSVDNGTYTVNLHFAETYSGITGSGQRVFTVTAEGITPSGWSSIDVFAQAGGSNAALIKTATVTVSDGTLNLGFSASVENTMISGIEIVPVGGGDTTAPTVPTGVAGSSITSSSFTFSWTAATDNVGVTGYEVFRDGTSIATPNGTSVSVTGLSASTTYAMRVRARDAAGNWSAQSTAVNVTTSSGGSTVVSFQDGVNGYAGTTDATISSSSPTTNYGSSTLLEADGDPDQGILLRFDLSSIPTSKTVTAVTLTFGISNKSAMVYEIYALKRAFAEGSATWNAAQSGTNWQTAGANGANDRETTVLGTILASSGTSITVSLNSSGIAKVQSWVSSPSGNYGFAILDYVNSDGLDLHSSETGTATQRPKITITYQ